MNLSPDNVQAVTLPFKIDGLIEWICGPTTCQRVSIVHDYPPLSTTWNLFVLIRFRSLGGFYYDGLILIPA